jgi:hypothetical protein
MGLETERLDDWLYTLGCRKGGCPSRFTCVWFPPNGLAAFTAPNPDYVHFVPLAIMGRLADVIADIMKNGGVGLP